MKKLYKNMHKVIEIYCRIKIFVISLYYKIRDKDIVLIKSRQGNEGVFLPKTFFDQHILISTVAANNRDTLERFGEFRASYRVFINNRDFVAGCKKRLREIICNSACAKDHNVFGFSCNKAKTAKKLTYLKRCRRNCYAVAALELKASIGYDDLVLAKYRANKEFSRAVLSQIDHIFADQRRVIVENHLDDLKSS